MSSAEGTVDFPGGADFPGGEFRADKPDNQAAGQPRPMNELLNTINDPADLRKLERRQLKQLADELRTFVLQSVSQTGGHLSSNLGPVELTIALHYVFDTP